MSKIILYQCDMCHDKDEELYTLKVKIPIVNEDNDSDEPDPLNRNSPDEIQYQEYDLCEECIRKLKKFIETFHKTPNVKTERTDENKSYVWFVEYNVVGKDKKPFWTRENGPFTDKELAKKALEKAMLMDPSFQHRLSCRIVPAWVIDFIECNIVTS